MKTNNRKNGLLARAPLASAVALALLAAPAAQAFEFENGDLVGSWDTTISYGISVRQQEMDPNLVGKAYFNPALCAFNIPLGAIPVGSGRCSSNAVPGSVEQQAALGRFSVNRDDGNVKYDDGDAFSNAFKITSELSLKYNDWGFFTRATYFRDFTNDKYEAQFTEEAEEKVVSDFRLLDAFIYKNFALGANDEVSGTLRFGRQVVSWGESTFIQNGINVINPIDVSKLRVAGAELKEAFLPVNMLWGSIKFSETLSLEAFYQLDWQETEIDPAGTYFSANDFASPGGTYVMLGFGTAPQPVFNPDRYAATCLPIPSASSVLNSDLIGSLGALAPFACGNSVPRLADIEARDSGQFGFALRWYAEALNETEFGFYAMNYHSRIPLLSGVAVSTAALLGVPTGLTAGYFVEYPEDLKLFGISWNTTLPGGIAWQGEYSYRPNSPLQVDDVELLFAALTPLNNIAISAPGATPRPGLEFRSQLGTAQFGQTIKGWNSHKIGQLQMTFTKAFGQALGADQIATVLEVGATEVFDMPPHSVLRYEGEGTDTGGGPDVADFTYVDVDPTAGVILVPLAALTASQGPAGGLRNPLTQTEGFPTQFSWGYRLAARADYNSVFGTSITLSPRIAFNHDVSGITPGPGGNFLEGRKSLTVGLEANYLNDWVFDISYTKFSGAEALNQIHDRDFASFSVKYSF